MVAALKITLARGLSPKTLFWLRSVKRAVMGEPPLEPPTAARQNPQRSAAPPAAVSKDPPRDVEPSVPRQDPQLSVQSPPASSQNPEQNMQPRIMQTIAIERLDAKQISAPYLFFGVDDILVEPARDIARTLMFGVLYINSADIRGDIAEFGTMGGFTARSIAAAMIFDPKYQPSQPLRKLRLFDSFEGLPEITSNIDLASPHVKSGTWARGGCKVLSARELRIMVEGILPRDRVEINEGWFVDTVKALPDDTRFAMIHFDGDLYQSTMDALVPCFERGFISKGAILCFDDWNCNQADPEYGERRAWAELVGRFNIVVSHGGDYAIQSSKFIIHSYRGMRTTSG
jgi:O-methyltransferase